MFQSNPIKIDVRSIIDAAGIGSGLVLEIMRTIQRTNEKNAMLTLKPLCGRDKNAKRIRKTRRITRTYQVEGKTVQEVEEEEIEY